MHITRTPAHRRGLVITGLVAGALLAVAAPLAASAHVEVSPSEASVGSTTPLTFAFHHGCDESPTTALIIDVPEGVGNVTPVVQGGWTIQRTLGANDVPTQVTFTADAPIEPGLAASVSMEVLFDDAAAGTTVAFPVLQKCVTGQTSWTQIPAEGADEDSVDNPAPAVKVGAAIPDGGRGDSDGADSDGAAAMSHGSDGSADAASAGDPVARWLGAGGLAAGLAALVVVLVRGRARRP